MNLDVTCILLVLNTLNKKVSQIYSSFFSQFIYTQSSQVLKQPHETRIVRYCIIFQTGFLLYLVWLIYLIFHSNKDHDETVSQKNSIPRDHVSCDALFCFTVLPDIVILLLLF